MQVTTAVRRDEANRAKDAVFGEITPATPLQDPRPQRLRDHARAPRVHPRIGGFGHAVKRCFDRTAAILILVLAAVPMLLIAVAIKLTSPGPVFVRQERVGRFGRPFTMYKFRSMRVDAEFLRDGLELDNEHGCPRVFKMRRDPRVTRVGAFLRRTSLDELPNLFSVVLGDMSVVGPRPPLAREVMHYDERHLQRLTATPGLTGLWQILGRSELPFEEMVAIDISYINNWSLWLDAKILIKTPIAVLRGRGAW